MAIVLIISFLLVLGVAVLYLALVPGCSVKSVSLRSIRGFRITHRIGLSFGRQPNTSGWLAFRCSIRVSNVTCRSFEGHRNTPKRPIVQLKKPPAPKDVHSLRSRRSKFSIQNFAIFTNPSNDTVAPPLTILKRIAPSLARNIDHILRPVFRVLFVAAFRSVIRFLPTLMQAVDFELNHASLTVPKAHDLTLSVERVRVSTQVKFTQLEGVIDDSTPEDADTPALRRLTRMGNWRLRMRGSWDRTWNRAWGRTNIFSAVSINVGRVGATVRPGPPSDVGTTVALPPAVPVFTVDGASTFERQSMDLAVSLGALSVDVDNILLSARRVSEVLAPKRASQGAGPAPMNAIAEEPISPLMSPLLSPLTSPLLSPTTTALVLQYRRRFRERAKKRGTLNFAEVFKGIDFQLPTLEFVAGGSSTTATDIPSRLRFLIKDVFLKGEVSNPEAHELHRKWLGKSTTDGKAEALAFKAGFGMTNLGWMTSSGNSVVPLLTLDKFTLNALTNVWPESHRMHPNECLLAVEVMVDPLVVSSTMKDVHALGVLATKFKSPAPTKPSSTRSPVMHIPRLIVDIQTGGFNFLFCLDNHGSQSSTPAGLHLRVPQVELHGRSEFVARPWARRDQSRQPYTESVNLIDSPYVLRFEVTGSAGPADLQAIFEDRIPKAQSGRHNIIRLSQIDLHADGDILATLPDGASKASIDTQTTLAHARCVSDSFVIDLTNSEALSVIPDLLSNRSISDVESPEPEVLAPKKSLFARLPAGVCVHFAIATVSCLASGRDLAPGNIKLVKRGVELRTGVSVGYSSMHDRIHSYRTRSARFASDKLREELTASNDILSESVSVSHELRENLGEQGAVARLDVFNCQVRPIVDYGNAFIPLCDWESKPRDTSPTTPTALLFIPLVRVDVLLKRTIGSQPEMYHDTCRVVAHVPRVRFNLSVHHAYCLLLSSTPLLQLKPPSSLRSPPKPILLPQNDLVVHVAGHVEHIEARVDLPEAQNVYFRVDKLKLTLRDPHRDISFELLHGWALSEDGRWDEMLRVRHLEIVVPPTELERISIIAQGARLRIPHEYSLASLIQEISLAVKTVKHLAHITRVGHFVAMETPPAEDAKRVPPLAITINALVIEAVDDPFETKLSLLWRAGFKEQQERLIREEAFTAKAEAIQMEGMEEAALASQSTGSREWHFGNKHTVSVEDAYRRLQQFNSSAWLEAFGNGRKALAKHEENHLRRIGLIPGSLEFKPAVPLDIRPTEIVPPLIRLLFDGVQIELTQPTFAGTGSSLPEFLKRTGELPLDTEYTLLVPLNLRWEMRYAMVTLRDYPLPLLHVRPSPDQTPSWTATADLVIAEEIGPNDSVEWISTTVVPEGLGVPEQVGFSILIAKTGMPVKTYSSPEVQVTSPFATDISWGVSYQPCVADVMRIIDSLSHPSRDPSSPLGFWDKIRLSLHGKLRISFVAGLNLLVKGSRDPYDISGNGAGFALCWSGHPEISVGCYPEDKELVQFRGDRMTLGIPNLPTFADQRASGVETPRGPSAGGHRPQMQKTCAKLTNGVKFGLGFALERRCGPDCSVKHTRGDSCRLFTFRPHYEVKLRPSTADPNIDSFTGFRSNFIHFSMSLVSPSNPSLSKKGYNSFHLSPKAFAHFFSWWHVFNPPNGPMLLPIRQGSLYPSDKPPPLKFTRHLVTIKYRFSLSPLFISHVYRQDSRTSWATGITPCVGIKAVIETFQADLHQRDEIELIKNEVTGESKKKVHKPFYAAEVVAKGLDLRAMCAQFREPEKPAVDLPPLPSGEFETSSSARPLMPASSKEPMHSRWVDLDDFVETDWTPEDETPALWLFTVASCPRITYFKKPDSSITHDMAHTTCSTPEKGQSEFGNENTHICLMGTEESTIQIQAALCAQRLHALEAELSDVLSFQEDTQAIRTSTSSRQGKVEASVLQARQQSLEKKIELLREHLENLENFEIQQARREMDGEARVSTNSLPYDYPTQYDIGADWSQFDNIYHIHCPQVHLNNYTRNIILDYYYSSRNRRGFEYHLSERAVRFIREQSPSFASKSPRMSQDSQDPTPRNRAQAAAHTIRKIFTADGGSRDSAAQIMDVPQPIKCQAQGEIEPASGWKTDDIIVNKSHMCLLLNPQFTMRSTADDESILVITVNHASLQTFSILDKKFVDDLTADPINANIMKRNYGSLSGLQIFSPSRARDRLGSVNSTPYEVPLEVLLDRRCESNDFDRLVPQTDATIQYDKFNRLRLRNKTSATDISAEESDINNHLQAQNDRIILNVDQLAVSANAQNFAAIYNIVSDLLLYTDPDQRERNSQLQTFMYSYDFKDFMASASVVSDLQQRLRTLLDNEAQFSLSTKKEVNEDRLINRAHIFLLAEELNLIFKAIRLVQEQGENAADETKSNMRFDAFVKEISWKMLEATDDTLAKLSIRGIEYAWHSQKDSSAAHKLVINDLQALDSSPDAVFPEMLVKFDKVTSHPMVTKSLFAQAEWSILAPVGGIPIVNSFVLDLHPIRLQFERKVGRKILSYIFARRDAPAEAQGKALATSNAPKTGPSTPRTSYSATVGPGHRSRSSVGAIAGIGLSLGSGAVGIPRASLDSTSLESAGDARPRTLKKRATSHTNLQEVAAASSPAVVGDDSGLEGHRTIPRSRSSNALRTEAKRPPTPSKAASRAISRPTTGDKDRDRERERELEAKDDANEMRVRASKNRTFVYVKVSGLVLALSYKRDTPMSLTTVPDLDDFRFETPAFSYANETWSFEDMIETLRKDIYKAAWAQKGALLREIFTKAKIITPKRFLPHEKWMHKRPKDKSAKQALPAPETEKEPLDSPVDQDSMVASDSGLALFHRYDPFSSTNKPPRPSLPENGSPIGFPSDQEPSPTPRSIASSHASSGHAFPTSAESEGRASTTSRGGRSSSIDRGARSSRDEHPTAFAFPTPPSPPQMSVRSGHTGSHRPTRERVLSLFKKKKKEAPVDDGMPRRTLEVPPVPPLPGTENRPRQRTISAHAKMQQQFQ
ncbi:golgi-body localization protein domain-containing protein [Rhizoctonia solani]|nr:golgi-body localization protein domain-containing protein [Rhizoctonia solani]